VRATVLLRSISTHWRSPFARFAVLLPAVLLLAILLVLWPSYRETMRRLDASVRDSVQTEIEGLEDLYDDEGKVALVAHVRRRVSAPVDPSAVYLLRDGRGAHIVGNLDAVPTAKSHDDVWVRFHDGNGTPVVGKTYVLDDGLQLFVGRRSPLASVQEHFRTQLGLTLIVVFTLALLAGVAFTRRLRRRIDALNRGLERIRAGRVDERLPVSGSGDELDHLVETLNRTLAQLAQLMAGARDVSIAIAHDIRQPLARVRNRIEALRDGLDPLRRQESEQILADVDQVLAIFAALLRLGRLEAGEFGAARTSVALDSLLFDVADLYQAAIDEQGRNLRYQAQPVGHVHGDRDLLFQLLANLLDNALLHGAGDIELQCQRVGDQAELSVRDHGLGIPAARHEQVLDRFVRLDPSRSRPGSGLGLALVRAIAQFHGGQLLLEDAAPGLRVRVRLPLEAEGEPLSTA
jgi:signal transduction histidine kinase